MISNIKPIILPSFLRRAMKAYALKSLIRAQGCELQRIGRSRNWKLIANKQQLFTIINEVETSNEDSWQWLAQFLRKQQESFTFEELVTIAKQNSRITVNQLMARTDCTIAQARKVIDELEFQD